MSTTDQKPVSLSDTKRCVQSLRRRLAHWELQHLRTLAAELHEQLQEAERRAQYAEDSLDMWTNHAMQLQSELLEAHPSTSIGLTKAGALVLLQDPANEVQP